MDLSDRGEQSHASQNSFYGTVLSCRNYLFDGHLREKGVLDFGACSKFVEEQTGLRVVFASKLVPVVATGSPIASRAAPSVIGAATTSTARAVAPSRPSTSPPSLSPTEPSPPLSLCTQLAYDLLQASLLLLPWGTCLPSMRTAYVPIT